MSPANPPHRRPRTLCAVAVACVLTSALLTAAVHSAAAHAVDATPAPVSRWQFDEGTGTAAADSAGAHPATLTGAAGWTAGIQGESALSPNGGYADAGPPAFDPTRSFTVTTWLRLNTISGYQTAVSIDGTQVSSFYLGLRDDTKRFAFVRLPADAAAGAPAFPSAGFDPAANQWYHLAGVFDSTAQTLSLYVNGRLQASTPAPATWQPPGHMVIGRGRFAGNPVDFVRGGIDDVRAYDTALSAAQVAQLSTTGSWRLDEGTGTVAADDSANHYDGTLTGGATWTAGVAGPHAVAFNGSDGFIDTPASAVDTAQSFSVAAWVRTQAGGFRTAVSVDGDQVSGFFLQQRSDGRFAFTMLSVDATSSSAAVASAGTTARQGQWYHLAGVYDRAAGTAALYVNGTLAQTVSAPAAWRAGGHLVIGRAKYAGNPVDFWSGAVDDVHTFPFPLNAASAAGLATSGLWHFDEGSGTVARDSSANRADGTLRAAAWAPGASGTAVALDGHGDVTMGDVPGLNLGTGSASVSAWFRTAAAGTQPIVGKGAAAAGDPGYQLSIVDGRVTATFGGGADRIAVASTAGGYADGGWHAAAVVLDRDAQRLRLFLAGEAVPVAPLAGSCGTAATSTAVDVSACGAASGDSPADFTVGSTSGSAPLLTGAVDEVQVVRFPLSDQQVATLAGANTISVDAGDIRATTRGTTYGSILEDISHSVEGGLYAELVRNRAFKETGTGPVPYWSLVAGGGASGTIAVDPGTPLNTAIDRSLHLHADALPAGSRLGVANAGFYGVSVTPATTYQGSFYAKAGAALSTVVRVSLEKADGTVIAGATVRNALGTGWRRSAFTIRTPAGIAAATDNRIVVSLAGGTGLDGQDVWLTQVSLFPPTFRNRPNGARQDIAAKLANLHLGLFRIPGGNYLEGNTLETRFNWKNTIGPVEQRPGHQNTAWGYWSTDGFGILEYLRLAEDIGAQPLLAVFAGYTLNGQHVSENDYGAYIQDALDEIQYAIGDTSTPWGARRAADGHPKPFDLHYVEVGNEDAFDGSGSYGWRFARMYDAIKSTYPQLKVIATTATGTATDLVDDHYYNPPSWFVDNATRYDKVDRNGPQVLVGEYGAIDGSPTGTLRAAVGEAAFLTGLERNSDIVIGSMYAPVIVHEGQPNWPTNLIGIDAGRSYGSPSYWVQQMFSTNLGTQVVGARLTGAGSIKEVVTKSIHNGVTTFYVKIVNPTSQIQSARLSFFGVRSVNDAGVLIQLTGDPSARNSLADPAAVVPQTRRVTGLGDVSRLTVPPNSVTVLRVTAR
jgi:alpha-L-arabinofuranosidase